MSLRVCVQTMSVALTTGVGIIFLVSQCKRKITSLGIYRWGDCNTDLECSSFCCNPSSQVCGVHMKTYEDEVLCSKPPESSCVSKEFCRKENIVIVFIVTTGVDPLGNPECAFVVTTYSHSR